MKRCVGARLIAVVVVWLSLCRESDAQILTGLVNTAAKIGTQAVLYCTTNSTTDILAWEYYYPASAPSQERIYLSTTPGDILPPFKIERPTTSAYNLIIPTVDSIFGVKYQCWHPVAPTHPLPSKTAQLVVLDSAQCPASPTEVLNGTVVQVTCSVAYYGAIRPNVTWVVDGGSMSVSALPGSAPNNVSVTATVTLGPEYDGVPWDCHVSFAGGVPDYRDNCSTVFYIQHGVTDIQTEPPVDDNGTIAEPLPVGSVIICRASGRPAPTYRWFDPRDLREVSSNANLTVTHDMVAVSPVTYTCEAKNNVTGAAEAALLIRVTFTATEAAEAAVQSSTPAWVIAVAVVVPIVGILLIVAIVCIIYRYRRLNKDKKPKTKTTTTTTTTPVTITHTTTTDVDSGQRQPFLTTAAAPEPRYPPAPYTNPYTVNGTTQRQGSQDRLSAGFGDLGGSSNRIYTPAPSVNMRPNPISYPYQPPPSAGSSRAVAAAVGPGTAAPMARQSSLSSQGSNYIGHAPPTGPPPALQFGYNGSVAYQPPSVHNTSHHSSLV